MSKSNEEQGISFFHALTHAALATVAVFSMYNFVNINSAITFSITQFLIYNAFFPFTHALDKFTTFQFLHVTLREIQTLTDMKFFRNFSLLFNHLNCLLSSFDALAALASCRPPQSPTNNRKFYNFSS